MFFLNFMGAHSAIWCDGHLQIHLYTEILVCPSGASLLANTSSSVWAGNGDGCGYLGDLAVKHFVLSLWLRLLAHMHDATQLFLHTCSMLRNCTCTHARCYATVLAHMHHATQFYLHTCTMLRNYTLAHARCYANLLAHMLVATQLCLYKVSFFLNQTCKPVSMFSQRQSRCNSWEAPPKYRQCHLRVIGLKMRCGNGQMQGQATGGWDWAAEGLKFQPSMPLFPGYTKKTLTISLRSYLRKFREAERILEQDRTAFQDFNLKKLGSHSLKKSFVNLMKEEAVPWYFISDPQFPFKAQH